jgi:glycosyltransferase involved in cell wall biosynthesis
MNKKIAMNKKKSRIALIGVYPPPYGGISVHIQRLNEQLEKKGFGCIIYDSGKKKDILQKNVKATKNTKGWMLKYFLNAKEDIVHYHGYEPKSLLLFSLFSIVRKKRVIFTFHSFRYNIKDINLLHKFIFWIANRAKIYLIVVGPQIKEKIISLGIKSENIEVIPSFIPPTVREEDIAEIPQEVWAFMNSHNPVIAANAYKISYYNNQDLYGIDMCIDLCANLKQYYPGIGLVFSLPDIGDYEYFEKMKQRIADKGIENNFLFITEPYQFYPILMKSDVFVRPTNTDGDAVSLREALYFKVPAVASDAVPRPEGTILFKSRDTNDFTIKVKDVLDNYEPYKRILETVKIEDSFEKIMKFYQMLSEYKNIQKRY